MFNWNDSFANVIYNEEFGFLDALTVRLPCQVQAN
jgi:hypothetical protein